MAVFTVSTSAQLTSALDAASGGDRIELAPGDYGDVNIQYKDFSSTVTITSADPTNMAVFNTIKLYEANHLTFDQIQVDFTPDEDTLDFENAVRVVSSSDFTFRDSVINGGTAQAGIDPDSPSSALGNAGIEGYPIGNALGTLHTDNIVIEGSEFNDFKSGVGFAHADGVTVIGNVFDNMRTVQLIGANVDNVEIRDNHFADINPWHSPTGGGDHGDYIHLWTTDVQDGPNVNINIADNFFVGGSAGVMGIYIEDNEKGKGYENVTIENNLIHAGHAQGIYVERTNDLLIKDNTLLANSSDPGTAPGVLLSQGNTNVVVDNNVLSRIVGADMANAEGQNITSSGNLFVQNTHPKHDDYVDNFFVNSLSSDADLGDFLVLPGTAATGVGADITQYQSSMGSVAGINAQNNTGYDMLRLDVSAELLYGSSSGLDLAEADITWDFGDGTTVSGQSATHAYLVPGDYDVTATVVTKDGETVTLSKAVIIETPYAVDIDFEAGFEDLSYFENPVVPEGDVRLEATELGTSASLADSSSKIRIRETEELVENDAFSIGIDFTTTAGNTNDGTLIYFSANVYASLREGELKVTGVTDEGETFDLLTDGANLNDGEWHQLIYTFDGDNGAAKLYVDGAEVDQINNLEGGQKAGIGQDFFLGNPFGGSFTGQFDNLSFVRDAMSPDQVEQEFQNFQAELSGESSGPVGQITETSARDADNDQASSKELSELQGKIATKLAFANGPSAPQDRDEDETESESTEVTPTEDPMFETLLQKIYSLLVGLFGGTPAELENQIFTASQTAGVSDSGDEDDLYTLIPPTGDCDEGAMDEDCDAPDTLALSA